MAFAMPVTPLYIILIKIVEVAEIKYLFYIRIASENLGITCYYQQFIIRVLCFFMALHTAVATILFPIPPLTCSTIFISFLLFIVC